MEDEKCFAEAPLVVERKTNGHSNRFFFNPALVQVREQSTNFMLICNYHKNYHKNTLPEDITRLGLGVF